MVMVKVMIPMPMALLKIHRCMHIVDMLVMASILNRHVYLNSVLHGYIWIAFLMLVQRT